MLGELNVKPRINYLAKLTNPAGDQARAAVQTSTEHHE